MIQMLSYQRILGEQMSPTMSEFNSNEAKHFAKGANCVTFLKF